MSLRVKNSQILTINMTFIWLHIYDFYNSYICCIYMVFITSPWTDSFLVQEGVIASVENLKGE